MRFLKKLVKIARPFASFAPMLVGLPPIPPQLLSMAKKVKGQATGALESVQSTMSGFFPSEINPSNFLLANVVRRKGAELGRRVLPYTAAAPIAAAFGIDGDQDDDYDYDDEDDYDYDDEDDE